MTRKKEQAWLEPKFNPNMLSIYIEKGQRKQN